MELIQDSSKTFTTPRYVILKKVVVEKAKEAFAVDLSIQGEPLGLGKNRKQK